jgi:coenzyme F420-reducing hydrogenase alpha subunit
MPIPATGRPASIAAAWLTRRAQALEAAEALADGRPYPRAAAGESGWGVGQTLTARGVLTHAVRLEGGRVADYRVWAPTDGHFADAKDLSALLTGTRWTDGAAARQALAQAVLALDPCLPHTIEVEDA